MSRCRLRRQRGQGRCAGAATRIGTPGPSWAYVAAQWTWGLPQTLLGAALAAANASAAHSWYRSAFVTYWGRDSGLSLGMFLFLPRACAPRGHSAAVSERAASLHAHEFGHTIQSIVLGPAYLLLVGLPSLAWAGFPPLARAWRSGRRGYYSFATERNADYLAARFARRP